MSTPATEAEPQDDRPQPEDRTRPHDEPSAEEEAEPDEEPEAEPEDVPEAPRCGNCETTLTGPFCHRCGQAVRSPVREFFSFMFDSATEFLRPDGKFFRSLAALYFRPGLLTTRYLAGQRTSFIKPVKLYLTLSLVLFLLVSLDLSIKTGLSPDLRSKGADVSMGFEAPKAEVNPLAGAFSVEFSDEKPGTRTSGGKADSVNDDEFVDFEVKGKPWHETTNPVVLTWLPGFANHWLNAKLARLNEVGDEVEKHPEKVLESLFRVLPTMMFLLLPVFALVLKAMYFFRNRLYAEHLLVAVQSHSFLFLSFILLILLTDIAALVGPSLEKFTTPLAWLVGCWMPLYLYLMQKRVYRQGWFWSAFKYSVVGFTYVMLLGVGLTFSVVAALVNM